MNDTKEEKLIQTSEVDYPDLERALDAITNLGHITSPEIDFVVQSFINKSNYTKCPVFNSLDQGLVELRKYDPKGWCRTFFSKLEDNKIKNLSEFDVELKFPKIILYNLLLDDSHDSPFGIAIQGSCCNNGSEKNNFYFHYFLLYFENKDTLTKILSERKKLQIEMDKLYQKDIKDLKRYEKYKALKIQLQSTYY